MDRVWQRLWDRHGSRYSWALAGVTFVVQAQILVTLAVIIVRLEDSDRYLAGAGTALVIALVIVVALVLPGLGPWRPLGAWVRGDGEALVALESTYAFARSTALRAVIVGACGGAALGAIVGTIAGATDGRVIEYGLHGLAFMVGVNLIALHTFVEGGLRPPRLALTAGTDIGDALPRARPSFAAWSNIMIIATAWVFAAGGASIAAAIDAVEHPLLLSGIAAFLTVGFAAPITAGLSLAPALQPIRDLAQGTERVAAGDFSQRLPVVQDDDLGALAASFNRMQAGLEERARLQAAFGTYVDPALAARLLDQGDDIFTGERRQVTVVFIDIRDFTPFAEANSAEDTVARLNALFAIVVPEVLDAGGHVNKFLGDGAMAVFGAPNELAGHADAAVAAATRIQQLVAEHFEGTVRIGIGINSGAVVAGTIGGGGKLEFTLIGDTVNVAARVEQLTKATGDTILLTQDTVAAMTSRPDGLRDRGAHPLKGKATSVHVYGLGPEA